jgi:hypothetical protein
MVIAGRRGIGAARPSHLGSYFVFGLTVNPALTVLPAVRGLLITRCFWQSFAKRIFRFAGKSQCCPPILRDR